MKQMVDDVKLQGRRRIGLVVCSMLYTFLFIGAFFGWGPMQLLLEKNGSFSSKCSPEEQEEGDICPAQSSALLNVQFYAQVSQVTSPLLGHLADHYGATSLAYLMTVSVWLGLALFTVATVSVDQLLYPAFLLLAQGTWMGAILSLHTGMMFAGQSRSRVIFGLNALFDAAAITYLGLWAIGDASGASLTLIIGGYLIVALVVFGGGSYFWTVATPEEKKDEEDNHYEMTKQPIRTDDYVAEDACEADVNMDINTIDAEASGQSDAICETPGKQETGLTDANVSEGEDADVAGNNLSPSGDYVPLSERSSLKQLTSPTFLLIVFFFTVQTTANQWTLTTIRDFLAYLGDNEVGNRYTLIFSLMMPLSVAAVPFTDIVLRKYGFHGGFQATNILALGYNLIRLLSDNLNVQIIGFLLFSFFRSFLYGVSLSFLPSVLGPNVVGKACGIMFAITGAVSFVNIPLASFALEKQNGDFFIPNLIYTILVIPCIVAAWLIGREIEREKRSKGELADAKLRMSLGGVLRRDDNHT
jgi:MFS family permease